MSHRIDTDADVALGLAALLRQDPRLAEVARIAGPLPLRRRPGGFAGLAAIVVAQQVSTASAAAIWKRFSAAYQPLDAQRIRRARTSGLARVGLSAPKIRTLKALARAVGDGALDLAALDHMTADEAHAALTPITGIGPWTADIYLLFCVGHADAWPAGDLALQEAVRLAFAHEARPKSAEMIAIAEPWRPWRGVAARLFWAYYAAVKRRDPVPVQPTK
jgi:DNA-3-methyladenine glycosylase II